MANGQRKPRAGVLTAIAHELVKREQFETIADVAEALKCEAARLRIPYDGGRVSDALRAVERTRAILREDARPRHRAPELDPRPFTRDEARDLLAAWWTRRARESEASR